MQVNHEEVDTVLGDRQKRIQDNMMHMQREVESKSKEWIEVRVKTHLCPVRLNFSFRGRFVRLRPNVVKPLHTWVDCWIHHIYQLDMTFDYIAAGVFFKKVLIHYARHF